MNEGLNTGNIDADLLMFYPTVKFKRVHSDAKLPTKKHDSDSCWDLYSISNVVLSPMEIYAVDTGLQMELPPHMEATIRPRSGLALNKGITVVNSPGTIDSGYRGNIKVILINFSEHPQSIKKGERIAQMKIGLTYHIEFEEVEELNDTERGEGGFGSTGTH